MGKGKQFKFEENATFAHVVQPPFEQVMSDAFPLKGTWNRDFFRRDAPLILELGCGKGEYTTGLAQLRPGCNYIGVDIKGARIWRGARTAKELGLANVGFLRTHVDHLLKVFGPGEVNGIWLTFSDPQLGKDRKKLTSPLFLERYRQVLAPGGVIHLKTDSPELYHYTLDRVAQYGLPLYEHSADVYGELVPRLAPADQAMLNIRTFYESMWLGEGKKIHYCRFGIHPLLGAG
ncbi:MAG TPA: tRNA (guanosine(46)-N7)-methyltransferase TrmB [Flavobacteriales bacterium]|nr:tRNA (guanosine(46)-N7)-methyltransferase TrmB [Flavobacteriales bacterium]MCC6656246.1 tRNA (guanosine(46)-N7)-methyltransferase TrmB [Flavobacteriales bacterium]HMW98312.1 tRNA (guanosine(46)-N7)-methyltransferase TrmB [Flavobacteriales bacterium]HMZ49664.1 tRNA (guanosine(46)-N7)-methyltransferase TrmB [Flavobacteriales bacterium]HNA33593.1 tRNA (guanosine(46)-N7)-methyltransferase TrmB [Flavobacteriales bacterium]